MSVQMVRLVLTFSLVTAGLIALAPPAAASCTVTVGPAGACLTDFNHQTGDPTCEDDGYHYGSTYGTATVQSVASAGFAGDHSCLHSGDYQRETQQIRVSAALWGVAVFELRYTDSHESQGDWCAVDAFAYTDASGGVDESAPCRSGAVPILPWGGLLP